MKKIIVVLFGFVTYLVFGEGELKLTAEQQSIIASSTVINNSVNVNQKLYFYDVTRFIDSIDKQLIDQYQNLGKNDASQLNNDILNFAKKLDEINAEIKQARAQLNFNTVGTSNRNLKEKVALLLSDKGEVENYKKNSDKMKNRIEAMRNSVALLEKQFIIPENIIAADIERIKKSEDAMIKQQVMAKLIQIQDLFLKKKQDIVGGYKHLNNILQQSNLILENVERSMNTEIILGITAFKLLFSTLSSQQDLYYDENTIFTLSSQQLEDLEKYISDYKVYEVSLQSYLKNQDLLISGNILSLGNEWTETVYRMRYLRNLYQEIETNTRHYYRDIWILLCSREDVVLETKENIKVFKRNLKGEFEETAEIKKEFKVKNAILVKEYIEVILLGNAESLQKLYIKKDDLYKVKIKEVG